MHTHIQECAYIDCASVCREESGNSPLLAVAFGSPAEIIAAVGL